MVTAYISHPDCALHDMGNNHPECPRRLNAISDCLIAAGTFDYIQQIDAPKAELHHLQLAHDRNYINNLLINSPKEGLFRIDEDTALSPHTLDAAMHSAGAMIRAVDGVMSGEFTNAFCATRPPGHHAERAKANGFCFFNNIAIAAHYAVKHHRVKKVAVIDIDIHHGNGTEDILGGSRRIQYWSSFESDIFPFRDNKLRSRRNVSLHPIATNCSGSDYKNLINDQLMPWIYRLRPQLILLSTGFDGHIEDEISHSRLTDNDYRWVIEKINGAAKVFCQGRIISTLEGGYNLSALGRCGAAHVKELAGL
ncbi:acetoin utilization deacetylase AcuC-like enzyme [Sinobacterium caligoides]|uniref:Acetoin utilization deacetylase AcuC-like enzyme n=1 Tax=Sinobacterium caligoides TaxID=933926 RepID=A0A3N2DXN0_9GAMM|nr:histone deacetylase family protein [Sinobacterium caligoides]ROS04581.1 acetoin utilization deacetylase AcuC-like enzyme [Sinobacterium caligoides]